MFKLTRELPKRANGAQQDLITCMDLTQHEFCALAQLSAKQLNKTRYGVPPFGIDVFEGTLEGLFMAEADDRFNGGRLVCASRQELKTRLSEYGIGLRTT